MMLKDKFRALRTDKGVTLRQMSAMIGFSVAYIHDMESGHREITPAILDKYLEYNFLTKDQYSEMLYVVTVRDKHNKMPDAVRDYLTENQADVVAYINKKGDAANG